ncbi:MAG: baseplate wedge protein 53 [Minisyncoccia bacterium]
MYFDNFPVMLNDYKDGNKIEYKLITDISANVRIRKEILANVTLYDEYDIRDGETPEIIAEKVYGSPLYHWVVMLCNERYDYIDDFPLASYELEQHITDKYGAGNEYDIHHWIDTNGNIVHQGYPGSTSVSNYEYEQDENEKKRRIKLISASLLQTIIRNFKDII